MQTEQLTLQASVVKTADFDSVAVPINIRDGRAFLDVSAASGTSPTLDVVIQEKDETSDNYVTIATFAQVTAVSTIAVDVSSLKAGNIRAKATIGGGTPSFTYSVGFTGKEGDQD